MVEKIESLISEKDLASALGISRSTLVNLRKLGLPWISLGGHVFYHQELFMEWILKNCQNRKNGSRTDEGQR